MCSDPVPNVPVVAIEADDVTALDNDSAFRDSSSDTSSKTSLTSGIAKYRIENGRSYHAYKEGSYLLPNDEAEHLDLHHHVFNLVAGGKLAYAPVEELKPARVLDAGTGTGIWAIDFADQYPASHVIDDIESPWSTTKPYNYIHVRSLAGSLLSFQKLIAQTFANLAPGGYLEVVEFEVWVRDQKEDPHGAVPERVLASAPRIQQWQAGLKEAGEKIGRRFDAGWRVKGWMEEVGFGDVVEEVVKVPNTPWPKDRTQKEIGLYQQQNMLDASSSYGNAHFTRILNWTNKEFDVLSAGVRAELKDKKLQLYSNLYVVYGQKPVSAETE